MNGVTRRKLPAPPQSPYMTVAEVAERLRFSDAGIRLLIKRGDLEVLRVGRRVLVKRESVSQLEAR